MTMTDEMTDALAQTPPSIRLAGWTTAFLTMLTGGSLFAFSTFVMPALRREPAAGAVAAMQAINRQAPRSLLMVPLVGAAAGGAVLIVLVLARSGTPNRALLVAGALLAAAPLVITGVYHQPHNLALARLDPRSAGAAAEWARYVSGWTAWNHVRTAAALASGLALTAGLVRRG